MPAICQPRVLSLRRTDPAFSLTGVCRVCRSKGYRDNLQGPVALYVIGSFLVICYMIYVDRDLSVDSTGAWLEPRCCIA